MLADFSWESLMSFWAKIFQHLRTIQVVLSYQLRRIFGTISQKNVQGDQAFQTTRVAQNCFKPKLFLGFRVQAQGSAFFLPIILQKAPIGRHVRSACCPALGANAGSAMKWAGSDLNSQMRTWSTCYETPWRHTLETQFETYAQ